MKYFLYLRDKVRLEEGYRIIVYHPSIQNKWFGKRVRVGQYNPIKDGGAMLTSNPLYGFRVKRIRDSVM